MLQHMKWNEASTLIEKSLEKVISNKTVTYDLERQMEGAKVVKCSEFGQLMIKAMDTL
jgi:isocitrate dehydrogenase